MNDQDSPLPGIDRCTQERIKGLIERNAASQSDLDSAMDRVKTIWSAYESAKAQRASKELELARELEVAKSALDTANWYVDQQTLKAPIDGVVLDRPLSIDARHTLFVAQSD